MIQIIINIFCNDSNKKITYFRDYVDIFNIDANFMGSILFTFNAESFAEAVEKKYISVPMKMAREILIEDE